MLSPNFRTQAPSTGPFVAFEQSDLPAPADAANPAFVAQMNQALKNSSSGPGAPDSCLPSSSGSCAKPASNESANLPPGTTTEHKPSPPRKASAAEGGNPEVPASGAIGSGWEDEAWKETSEPSKRETINLDSLCSVLLLAGLGPQSPGVTPSSTTMVELPGASTLPADAGSEPFLASATGDMPAPSAVTSQPAVEAIPVRIPPSAEQDSGAAQNHAPPAQITPATPPKQEVESSPPVPEAGSPEEKFMPASPTHGTASAKRDLQMKKTAENVNLSPARDQSLPSAATLSSAGAVSAVNTFTRREEQPVAPLETFNGFSLQYQDHIPATEVSSIAGPEAPASFERVEQTILNSAIELKRLGKESMSVVLRPDHQTELHLHLVVSNGQVDVEARVSRGDLAHLQSHWSNLQQNLASQGVRLQSVEGSRDFAQEGGGGFGNSSHFTRQGSDESRRRDAMLEAELNRLPFNLNARTNVGRRLWESWA